MIRCLIAGAAALAALALSIFGATSLRAQDAEATSTIERAATLTVPRPTSPDEVYLDLWVKAYTPPSRGAIEAVVSIGPAGHDAAIEVGRFAVFPSEPFIATEVSRQRAYRFNAAAALRTLKANDKSITLRVTLVSLIADIPAEGAKLLLGKATFTTALVR
ncbi:MAG: hypothetical protein HY244_15140 [Rhizobiales bacterium]|nr:hypothetical protein [Hyphomicrobiales bacterium]